MSPSAGASDAQLLTAAASGDPSAWEALIEGLLPDLWAAALRFGLDDRDAADVCHVVFVRLAQNLSELAGSSRLATWVRHTGREECRRSAVRAAGRSAQIIDISAANERRDAARRAAITRGFAVCP